MKLYSYGICWAALCCSAVLIFAPARGQEANPADQPKEEDSKTKEGEKQPPGHLHSWQLPREYVQVTAERLPELREEDLVGKYHQPRWTARRLFGETRIYVIPEGDIEFEYWLIPERSRETGQTDIETRYEVEMGLPKRFQIDIYAITHQLGNQGPLVFDESKFEVRWALANWGRIAANPTLCLEWVAISDEPDHVEAKVLLGDQIVSRLHWGANLVYEHEMGGAQANAYEVTAGTSFRSTFSAPVSSTAPCPRRTSTSRRSRASITTRRAPSSS